MVYVGFFNLKFYPWMMLVHDAMEVLDLLFICGLDVNVVCVSAVLTDIFA